jgi:hypothetical protein
MRTLVLIDKHPNMAVGTQRFFLGQGGGEEFVLITPSDFYIVSRNNLLSMIAKVKASHTETKTIKLSNDVLEIVRQELEKKKGTTVHKVHSIHGLWIELVEGVKMLRIE